MNFPTNEEIEQAVKELAKQSTAPDSETPDWMEADIRRGIMWALKRLDGQMFTRKEDYPESIFEPITEREWLGIKDRLAGMGISLDRLSAHYGRIFEKAFAEDPATQSAVDMFTREEVLEYLRNYQTVFYSGKECSPEAILNRGLVIIKK